MLQWFENLTEPYPSGTAKQPPSKLVQFCWHYTRGYRGIIIFSAVLVGIVSALQVLLFSFMGSLVDWLATESSATFLTDNGWTLFWMGVVVLVLIPGLGFLHSAILHQSILGNFPMAIRWDAHRYLLDQSFEFYQDEFAGRVATKVMQTSLAVREVVIKLFDVTVYVAVYFIGTIVLVGALDWRLMLPFVGWLVFYVGLLRYFLPKMRDISEKQGHARSTMTGRIVDSYTNIMTVKLFSHARREEKYARDSMDGFLHTVYPQMRYATWLDLGLTTSNAVLLAVVASIGIWSWMTGDITPGAVAIAVGLVLRMEGMAHWIMWELSSLFENIGTALDGMETIARPKRVNDAASAKPLVVSDGDVSFDEISFHYGKDKGVIEGLSLHVKAGQKLGLVGRSGAGKSTLVNLLLRLYDLQGGRLLIDGQDISTVTQESLRGQIGVVTQDTSLLHRSVRDNIAYGKPDASEDEIIAAAKRANAHDYILGLEDPQGRKGYDAHVGERGVKLSGGQRQRIAIARVFLKNAPILVLDEATSALDSEIEAAIQESLDELMRGKTVIAIAHRLSTIANLDRLIVIDNGKIIEDGDHVTLASGDGLYAELWNRQSGGFLGLDQMEIVDAAE
ncbi:MAG: ABC transporter ATP-binding protein [Pseudomonadota bacterium]